jgi:NAD(P)-dependent dehydrogenase (short-subunit alcohol dehydrogenase family)
VGASGGIGGAVLEALCRRPEHEIVHAVSRAESPWHLAQHTRLDWRRCDNSDEAIRRVVDGIADGPPLTRVVLCNGILHGDGLQPEKALEHIDPAAMKSVLEANAIVPILWLSRLTETLRRSPAAVVSVLSARVGSIGDNRLGGWYSYRASKAALNMLLRTAAIELARRAPSVKLLAFHPGTTDTPLSRPFQSRVPADKLFTPEFVAERLVHLMDTVTADGQLDYLDWQGKPITW